MQIIEDVDFIRWWNDCSIIFKNYVIKHKKHYSVGEEIVEVNFYDSETDFFTRAISHLELINCKQLPGLIIEVCSLDQSKINLPSWFVSKYYTNINNSHFTMSSSGNYILHCQFSEQCVSIQLINKSTNQAIVWVTSQKFLPEWERSFPFRQIFHHYFESSNYCLIHGAGVGINNQGVILTAKGGSGKSTTALACLSNGWQYIGDDFILVNTKTKYMYSLYNVAKLESHHLEVFSEFAPLTIPQISAQQKQQIFLYPFYKKQLCQKMKIRAIVTPEYDLKLDISILEPSSIAKILLAMAPSTMFLLKSDNQLFKKISDLCRALLPYKLKTMSNIHSIPIALRELL